MATGDANDITQRVKRVIPNRWFKWIAPYRDALIGGLADSASWSYSLIGYTKAQTRLATAYGIWLDILCYDFLGRFLTRRGLQDDAFRKVIKATVLQERVTRAGMVNAMVTLTGITPWVFEPWNTYDTGAYSGRVKYGSMGYGVGRGGYGSMNLPGQVFMQVYRTAPSGVPGVEGYGKPAAGYGKGAGEYTGMYIGPTGITNAVIEDVIGKAKPTGSTVWINFGSSPNPPPRRPLFLNQNSYNLAII